MNEDVGNIKRLEMLEEAVTELTRYAYEASTAFTAMTVLVSTLSVSFLSLRVKTRRLSL